MQPLHLRVFSVILGSSAPDNASTCSTDSLHLELHLVAATQHSEVVLPLHISFEMLPEEKFKGKLLASQVTA